MPLKSGRLTSQESAFVGHMVRINDPTAAAQLAGYRQPSNRGGDLMRRPAVVAEVQARVTHRLRTEGYEVGVGTLIEIAGDKAAPKAPRVMAAKALVELSAGTEQDGQAKPLHEMSRSELQQAAEDAKQYLAELEAPMIEGDVVSPGSVFD
ncbi:hypothetical protein HCU64_23710 [Methylobacterium sp. C25]|uniref:hypothetical protein n=1 Tax=Methylobacterium sp. C25 TaxID=2721622 RepID=UPI001F36267B|nr:hypothetical protein [Methylobacterium sp. C25]MCE4226752.1 hypothetical protein [Methylobacterium sp. C25]